ncbi:MAG: hypothetical protein KAI17_24750 [Thiotrichaceae bacterium]|nr:hypothetical protein [Thiotrichaceae bacterium]
MEYFFKTPISKSTSSGRLCFLTSLILLIVQLTGCMIPPFTYEDTPKVQETMIAGVDINNIQLTLNRARLYETKIESYLTLSPIITGNIHTTPVLPILDQIESELIVSYLDSNIEIVDRYQFMNTLFPDGERMLRQLYEPETMRLIKEMDVDYLLLILPYKKDYIAIGPVLVTVGIAMLRGEEEFSTIVFDLKKGIVQRRFDIKTEGKIYFVLAGLTGLIVGKEQADIRDNIQLAAEHIVRAITVPDSLEPIKVVVIGGLVKNQTIEPELQSD